MASSPLPHLGLMLFFGLLGGCAGRPAVQQEPPPDTPRARAELCDRALTRNPNDHDAHRCLRLALTRLGERPALIGRLTDARVASPDDELRWYFEGRARLPADVSTARRLFEECRVRLQSAPWCAFGLALAHGHSGRPDRALLLIPDLPTGSAEVVAEVARLRLAGGNAAAARAAADLALDLDPEESAVHLARAAILLSMGDATQAEAAIAEVITRLPDDPEVWILRARLARARHDTEAAMADLAVAVAADPDHAWARDELGRLLLASGRPAAAVEQFGALVDRHPEQPAFLVRLGQALLADGQAERAVGWANLALALDADHFEALCLQAEAMIATGAVADALAQRPRLYAFPPNAPVAYRRIGEALAARNHTELAEAEFAAGVAAYPEQEALWVAYAQWHREQKRLGRAGSVIARAISALPDSTALLIERAALNEAAGDRAAARTDLLAAMARVGDDPDLDDEIARLDFLLGDAESAFARWTALVTRHPRADRARLRLAQALREQGRLSEAADTLAALYAFRPTDARVAAELGEALLMARRKPEAIAPLRAALAGGADPLRVRPLLATALADTGHPEEADTEFKVSLAAEPGNRPLRMTYAHFLRTRGELDAAAALLRGQLARDPDDQEARDGLARLERDEAPLTAWPAADQDPALRALADRAPRDDAAASTVLRDEREVEIDARGVASIRHRRSVLIRRPVAIPRNKEAIISFHAAHDPVVEVARTLTPDGRIYTVAPSDQSVRDPHAGTPMFGDARQLILRFGALEPGAIVDYTVVTRRPIPELPGVWWDGYVLANVDHTVLARYRIRLPPDAEFDVAAPGMPPPRDRIVGDHREIEWRADALAGFVADQEPGTVAGVYISSLTRWAQVDAWFHRLYAPQAAPDEDVSRHARALVPNPGDRAEAIAEVYRFVDREIGYLGLEFGIGAYQPRPAALTLSRMRGDCKDKTALAAAMLREHGVDAYPALVRPHGHGPFISDHPSPGQFNHVLLFVPGRTRGEPDRWLDTTAGLHTVDAVPDALRGRMAFIVDGKGGRLQKIPRGTPAANLVDLETTFELTWTGGGQVRTTAHFTGDAAGLVRQRLSQLDGPGVERLLAAPGYLLGDGRAADTVTVEGLEETKALRLAATQVDPDLVALRFDGALVVQFDLGILSRGPLPLIDPRANDARDLEAARRYRHVLRIRPPGPYRREWTPRAFDETAGPVHLRVSETRRAGEVSIVLELDISPGDAPVGPALRKVLGRAHAELAGPLRLLPGEGFDRPAFLAALLAERPDDPRLALALGHSLLDARREEEAAEVLARAHRLAPDDPRTLAALAAARVRLGRHAEAEAALRRLLREPAWTPVSHHLLAAVLVETNRAEEARDLLEEARRLHPSDRQTLRQLIGVYARTEPPERALRAAAEATTAHPDDPQLQRLYGDLAAASGEYAVAERAYVAALAVAPNSPELLNNLAWLLRADPSRRVDAVAMAERAVTLSPEMGAAWDTLAELLLRSGRRRAALRAIDRAISVDPERRPRYETRRALITRGEPSD